MLQDNRHDFKVIFTEKEQTCIFTSSFGLGFVLGIDLQDFMEKFVSTSKWKIHDTIITNISSCDTQDIAKTALNIECELIADDRYEKNR